MMEFDLFLDESGKFINIAEHTVIGGFLLPSSLQFNAATAEKWRGEIIDELIEKDTVTYNQLSEGKKAHILNIKKNRRLISSEEEKELRKIKSKPYYIFDHCSENAGNPLRDKLQKRIVEFFSDKITKNGGYIVLFDNPNAEYHIDSNTTYLTIMSLGIMQLYSDLQAQNNGVPVIIHLHPAARANVTMFDEAELMPDTPLPGNDPYLNIRQYRAQLKNCAFLNGGSSLLRINEFNQMIDNVDILYDLENGNKSHPCTVICDYICNSYYRGDQNPFLKKFLSGHANLFIYDIFSSSGFTKRHDFNVDLMRQNHSWDDGLIELISRGFPKDMTNNYYAGLKTDKSYDQNKCVTSVTDYLYNYIYNREMMEEWVKRINLTINNIGRLRPSAYLELKANLLIFLHTLYTHLGMTSKVESTAKDFKLCVQNITEAERRNHLILLFCNRDVVACNDTFNYSRGREVFLVAQNYYEEYYKISKDLLELFYAGQNMDDVSETSTAMAVHQDQYGRIIGSYMQLLAHMIHKSDGDEKKKHIEEANDWYKKAPLQFTSEQQLSRCCQNLCDLAAECGDFEKALDFLYAAIFKYGGASANGITPKDGAERCKLITEYIGAIGKNTNVFILFHYVLVMHRAFEAKDPIAENMLALLLGTDAVQAAAWKQLCDPEYPVPSVLWHLGACIALSAESDKVMRKTAKSMMEYAYNALYDKEAVLRAISLAVCADMIQFMQSEAIPSISSEINKWTDELQANYKLFMELAGDNDPFKDIFETDAKKGSGAYLKKITQQIAF